MAEIDPGEKQQSDADKKANDKSGAAAQTGLVDALKAERSKRQTLETKLATLSGKVEGLTVSQPAAQQPARDYSKAELQQSVDDGKLSQAQADEISEQQLERRLAARTQTAVAQSAQTTRVQTEIDAYKDALPAIMEEGSDERAKVQAEYQYLVGLGHPATLVTEATALRAAFGPASGLQKGRRVKEPHQEGDSGAGDSGAGGGGGEPAAPKNLSKERKVHYQRQIDRGFYDGWDDDELKKELEYVKPSKKARAA